MTLHRAIQGDTTAQPYRFSARDYVLLSEHGTFDRYAKTELIEGTIYAVNAQYSRHARAQTVLLRRLGDACDRLAGVSAWNEASVSIDDESMPQPDIIVVSELPEEGPVPASSLLVAIEVADTSLDRDVGAKSRLYARTGIAEYWVADVNGRVIHQMWSPADGSYAERRQVGFGEPITAATVPGLSIETCDL